MYGTVSSEKHHIVSDLGGIPIDYKMITKVTNHDDDNNKSESGVDAVFDGNGGKLFKSSQEILRSGGRSVAYGGTPTADLDWLMMFT
jgi:NADPH:quinone reductase